MILDTFCLEVTPSLLLCPPKFHPARQFFVAPLYNKFKTLANGAAYNP